MNRPFLFTALIAGAMIGGVLTAQQAAADPGPMCSFQGEYFAQYYPCLQGPPSWMMQPGVRTDMKPGVGTSPGPFNQ
jgi:hypothetical protein